MRRPDRNCFACKAVCWVLFILVLLLALTACHPRYYPQSRPKYGDSTTPVGPDKSHFSKPKFE